MDVTTAATNATPRRLTADGYAVVSRLSLSTCGAWDLVGSGATGLQDDATPNKNDPVSLPFADWWYEVFDRRVRHCAGPQWLIV